MTVRPDAGSRAVYQRKESSFVGARKVLTIVLWSLKSKWPGDATYVSDAARASSSSFGGRSGAQRVATWYQDCSNQLAVLGRPHEIFRTSPPFGLLRLQIIVQPIDELGRAPR